MFRMGTRSRASALSRPLWSTDRTPTSSVPAVLTALRLWKLTQAEMATLLAVGRSTLRRWQTNAPCDQDLDPNTLERFSYILGIWKALQILFPDEALADEWVRRPNTAPMFGGARPLDRMLQGQVLDLYAVRRYLDGWRG